MTLKILGRLKKQVLKREFFCHLGHFGQKLWALPSNKAEQGRIHSHYQSRMGGQGHTTPYMPSSTPCSLTHADNHNCSIFTLSYLIITDQWTDRQTDRWMDKASYGVASL